jgi:hypothetical protein
MIVRELTRNEQIIALSFIPVTRILDSILTFVAVGYLGYHELNNCMAWIVTNLPLVVCLDIGVSAVIIVILYTMSMREKHQRIWMALVMIIVVFSTIPVITNIGTLLGWMKVPVSIGSLWSVCS